jgi:hypothetical protein
MRGTLSLSVIVILLLPIVASADWVMISLESAVNSSDLIVIGTLRNVSEETRKGFDYGMGEIKIDEVLSGNAEPGQTLSLVWKNESDIMCPRVEHRGNQNQQLIWLLKLKPGNKVAADNPGRVAPIEKKDTVLELLRKRETSNKSLDASGGSLSPRDPGLIP